MTFNLKKHNASVGFTLIELMLTIAIIAILAAIANASYLSYRERVDFELTVADIKTIEQSIERYFVIHNKYPATLNEVSSLVDPWGNPYQYLNISLVEGKGELRKDKNLVPVNTDYDLYSKGSDGESVPPFTSKLSHDDIVRANNGQFIGKAKDY